MNRFTYTSSHQLKNPKLTLFFCDLMLKIKISMYFAASQSLLFGVFNLNMINCIDTRYSKNSGCGGDTQDRNTIYFGPNVISRSSKKATDSCKIFNRA